MADRIAPQANGGTSSDAGFPDDFSAALARAGIDPNLTLDEVLTSSMREQVLMAEGRERAKPRFQKALDRAQKHGYQELATRIEGMVEAEAQRHARRGMRRTPGSDGGAAPAPAAPASRSVAPPLPMTLTGLENAPQPSAAMAAVGQAGRQGDPLGPIDWTAPAPGPGVPRETAGSTQPALADVITRWGLEQGGTAGDLAVRAGRGVNHLGRFAGDVSGYFGGQRAINAAGEGNYGTAAAEAGAAAAPYIAGPIIGGANRLLGAAGVPAGTARTFGSGVAGGVVLETASGRGPLISAAEAQTRNRGQGNPAVMKLQEQLRDAGYYNGPIDGILSPDSPTMKAKAAFDAAEKAKADAANKAAETTARVKASEAAEAEARAKAAETARLSQDADRKATERAAGARRLQELDDSPLSQTLKGAMSVGPYLGWGAGAVIGHKMQGRLANRAADAASRRAADADSIMAQPVPDADIPGRIGRINRFWSEGNPGRVEPFRAAPNTTGAYPYVPNTNVPSASDLYQPPKLGRVPVGRLGEAVPIPVAGLTEHVGTEVGLAMPARKELAEAQEAVDKDPNEANIQRLQIARARMAGSDLTSRVGWGMMLGSGSRSLTHAIGGNPRARPDVAAAEAERGNITNLLGRRRGGGGGDDLPSRVERIARANPNDPRGDWVPRTEPAVRGVTSYVSQQGRNEVFLDSAGNWQRRLPNGQTQFLDSRASRALDAGRPPPKYRRISQAEPPNFLAAYG